MNKPKTAYIRVCKYCQKLFHTPSKFSKICPKCDKSPKKKLIKNKVML